MNKIAFLASTIVTSMFVIAQGFGAVGATLTCPTVQQIEQGVVTDCHFFPPSTNQCHYTLSNPSYSGSISFQHNQAVTPSLLQTALQDGFSDTLKTTRIPATATCNYANSDDLKKRTVFIGLLPGN